jgi:dUTP pyrophosphatase
MAQAKYKRVNVPYDKLTAQQIIIATGRFAIQLHALTDQPVSFHQWARQLHNVCLQLEQPMLSEHEMGWAALRLIEEGLVEMTDNGPCPCNHCTGDSIDLSELNQADVLVKIKKLSHDAKLPKYAKPGDAGADVFSVEDVELFPGETKLVSLGFAMEIPEGWEMQVRSRSGLSTKGVIVTNSPGTIDSGYRGECKVILTYIGKQPYFKINKGDRIAQFVLKQAPTAHFEEVDNLSDSARGVGGFGSTGVK